MKSNTTNDQQPPPQHGEQDEPEWKSAMRAQFTQHPDPDHYLLREAIPTDAQQQIRDAEVSGRKEGGRSQ